MLFISDKKMKTIFILSLMLSSFHFLFSQSNDYTGRGVASYLVNYNAINSNTSLLNFASKRFKFLDEASKCELDYLKKTGSNMIVLHYKDVVATYNSYNEFQRVNLDEDAFIHSGEPSCLSISFKNNNYFFHWLPDRRQFITIKGYRFYYSIDSDSTANYSKVDSLINNNYFSISLPKSTKWIKIKTVLDDNTEIPYGSPVKLFYSASDPIIAVKSIEEGRKNDTLSHIFQFQSIGNLPPDSLILYIDYKRQNKSNLFDKFKLTKSSDFWQFSNKMYLNPQVRTSGGYEFYLEVFYQNRKTRFPSYGFYTTNINNRLKNDYYGFYVMNVGNNTWRKAYIDEVLMSIEKLGYGGLFEDDTWYRVSSGSADCYPPFAYSDSLWLKNLKDFLVMIKSSLKDYPVYFNGLYSKYASDLLNYTDGGMTEGFAYTHWSQFVSRPYWEELCNIGIECQNKYKKHWLALGGILDNSPIPRLFVLASYLLVSGDLSFYANATNYQTFAHYPEFDIPLGEPLLSPENDVNELKHIFKTNNTDYFMRWFENGLVVVNPNKDKFVVIDGLNKYLKIDLDNKLTINGGRLRTISASDTLYPNEGHIYLKKPTDGKGLFSPSITDFKAEFISKSSDGYIIRLRVTANDSSSKHYMKNPDLPLYIYSDLSSLGGPSECNLINDFTPASEKNSVYSGDFKIPLGTSISKKDIVYVFVFSTTGLTYVNKYSLNLSTPDSANLIPNFSFEIDANLDGLPDFWRQYYLGYHHDTSGQNAYSGKKSVYLKNETDTVFSGCYISVDINQEKPEPLHLSGWSKSKNVSGDMNSDYSIYADIRYNDDTYLYGQTAKFSTGTHDWEYSEKMINPEKPIKRIYLYSLFRRKSGEVWFDHLYLGKYKEPNSVSPDKKFELTDAFYQKLDKQIIINSGVENPSEVRLFNILGREIPLKTDYLINNSNNLTMEASSLTSGIYFIIVSSIKKTEYFKVLIY